MKLKYIGYVAGLALSFSLSSCGDFLEKVPDTRVELETIEQLRQLLINGYSSANYSIPCEFMTDNVIDNNSPNYQGVRYNLPTYSITDDQSFAFEDVTMGSGSDTPADIWESCYHAIACANAVLDRANEMKEEGGLTSEEEIKLNSVMGEAYMIRAYHHFILAQIFCMPYRGEELSKQEQGIPYMTTSETTVKPHYERGTLDVTYAKIANDIEVGVPLVNDAIHEVPKYHFNRAAANAFAARFYTFTRDYEKALKYADAAFNGTDPNSMMQTIWAHRGELYYISDIARYYSSMSRGNVFLTIPTHSVAARRTHGYRYTTNRDAIRATIKGPGPSWQDFKWSNSKTGETFCMHPCFNGVCGTAGQAEYGAYFGGISGEQFEYTDKLAGIGYAHVVRLEFWAEETILCRAEAKLFLGDKEGCLQDLIIWDNARKELGSDKDSYYSRFRAMTETLLKNFYAKDGSDTYNPDGFGIVKPIRMDEVCPSTKYQLTEDMVPYMQCIQHFRRIETVHNGMRLFDIKRLGLTVTHKIGRFGKEVTLEFLDPRYAIQVPTEVISAGFEPNRRSTVTSTQQIPAQSASENILIN